MSSSLKFVKLRVHIPQINGADGKLLVATKIIDEHNQYVVLYKEIQLFQNTTLAGSGY